MGKEPIQNNLDRNGRDQFLDRPLPSNTEAERVILGAILLNNHLLADALAGSHKLTPAVFYSPFHARVFEAMINLFEQGEQVEPILIAESLKAAGLSEAFASAAAVANLTYGLPRIDGINHYSRLILEKYTAREAIRAANALISELLAEEAAPIAPIQQAIEILNALAESGRAGRKPTVSLREAIPEQTERWRKMQAGEIVTISTGIPQIDQRLTGNGFEKRMFHVVGARPAAGKTSFALDVAGFNAACNKTVVFFSAELSREVILDRMLSPFAAVPRWQIAAPFLSQEKRGDELIERLTTAAATIGDFRIYINDHARTPAEVRAACRQIARENNHEIDVILLDYLQRYSFPAGITNQHQGLTLLIKDFAQLATEFGAAVVALSQLSRDIEKRPDQKPRMSDFRESGSVEEYARTAAILHSPSDDKPNRLVKIDFVKQGEGETFAEELVYYTPYMTFGGRDPLFGELNEYER